MDLRHLRYFIVVAEELNFTRAAERLHTVQPSLSSQIRRLEEIVGIRLLHRTSHHVALTQAGHIFLEEARKIVADIERAIDLTVKAADTVVGDLSIGFVSGMELMIFPQIMLQLHERYPDTRFHLISSTDPELINALRRQLVDVVFCAPITDPEISAEIACEVILNADLVVVLPVGHPLAQLERIPISSLASEPFIRPVPGKYPFAEKNIREIEAEAGIRLRNTSDADGALATLIAVGAGLGIGFMPDFMARSLPASVKARPFDLVNPPKSPVAVAYRREDKRPEVQLFMNFLRDYMQEHGVEVGP
jgi:LysR family transcriptional regulator, hca operon transcriptional activator